jgi:hypothetical protein
MSEKKEKVIDIEGLTDTDDRINTLGELYKESSSYAPTSWYGANIINRGFGRLLIHKEHRIGSFRNTSYGFTKEALNQTRGDYRKDHYLS